MDKQVFIPNRSAHDFTPARRYGRLVFLTNGMVDRYKTNMIYRGITEKMDDSSADDHLLIASLSIISSIASAILAYKHGKVNYLLFKGDHYIERTIKVDG
jgi:hypothetical protein|tara:strand:- start:1297 stop:1596 length:300 start_codon:yes stop_codon:yes gene_type:complete